MPDTATTPQVLKGCQAGVCLCVALCQDGIVLGKYLANANSHIQAVLHKPAHAITQHGDLRMVWKMFIQGRPRVRSLVLPITTGQT